MSTPLVATDRPVVPMTRPIYSNVGRVDRILRGLGALGALLLTLVLLRTMDADWSFSIFIFGGLVVAYLALSAYIRIDPVYYATSWSTLAHDRALRRERVRRLRGRPMR